MKLERLIAALALLNLAVLAFQLLYVTLGSALRAIGP